MSELSFKDKDQLTLRRSFVLSVNPGSEEEYERRHSPIWSELGNVFRSHGVLSYSIFLHPDTHQLFGYVEFRDEAQWQEIAQTEVCQRWWHYMSDIMPADPDGRPVSTALREVFHFSNP